MNLLEIAGFVAQAVPVLFIIGVTIVNFRHIFKKSLR